MSEDLTRPVDQQLDSTAAAPSDAAPTSPMRQNATATECDIHAKCKIAPVDPQPAQRVEAACPEPAQRVEIAHLTASPPVRTPLTKLSDKQHRAIDYLLKGQRDDTTCDLLRIHRSTLSRWKHQHPLFIAELNRRQQELWNEVAGDLRLAATSAVTAMRDQLSPGNKDVSRLRAARTLLLLVNVHRIAPGASNPIHLNDILDKLLYQQQPTAAASTFTDAQRQSLLNQLLQDDATAQAQENAEDQARRQARKNRQTVAKTIPSSETPPDSPPLVAGLPKAEEIAQNQSSNLTTQNPAHTLCPN
jgi:hypothetical protein